MKWDEYFWYLNSHLDLMESIILFVFIWSHLGLQCLALDHQFEYVENMSWFVTWCIVTDIGHSSSKLEIISELSQSDFTDSVFGVRVWQWSSHPPGPVMTVLRRYLSVTQWSSSSWLTEVESNLLVLRSGLRRAAHSQVCTLYTLYNTGVQHSVITG